MEQENYSCSKYIHTPLFTLSLYCLIDEKSLNKWWSIDCDKVFEWNKKKIEW